jgi:O-antigen ligase
MLRQSKYLIALGLLALPLVVVSGTQDPALYPRLMILAGVVAVVSLLTWFLGRRQPLPVDSGLSGPLWWLVLAYPIVMLMTMPGSRVPSESLLVVLIVSLWAGLVVLLNLTLRLSPEAMRLWVRAVVLVSIILPVIALLQYYDLAFTGLPAASPPSATMVNRNLLASALVLMLPIAALNLYRSTGLWRNLSSVAVALQVSVIILTNSRSGWLALVIILPLVIAVGWRMSVSRGLDIITRLAYASGWKTILVIGLTAAVLFATPWLRRADQDSVVARLAGVVHTDQGSVAERLLLWDRTMKMYLDHPAAGVGPGQWKLHINHYGTAGLRSADGQILFQRPHNDYLWILAENGPLGLLAYLALLAGFLAAGWRIFKDAPQPELKLTGALLGLVILAFAIDSTFSFPRERVVHLVLVALAMAGLWSVIPFGTESSQPGLGRKANTTLFVLILLGAATLLVGYSRLNSDRLIVQAIAERDRSNWPEVTALARQAETPLATIDQSATPYAYYAGLGLYGYGRIPDALEAFQRAYDVNPYHLHVINSLATCHEAMGQHREAAHYFEEALAISPTFQPALLNYAATLYNVGQYQRAFRLISLVDPKVNPRRYHEYKASIEAMLSDTTAVDTTTGVEP